MRGNFDSPLNRKNSDTTVDARGWMEWETGDPSPLYLRVTIKQGDLSGEAMCGPYQKPGSGKPSQIEWRCDVPEKSGRDFKRDFADANAAWEQNIGTAVGSWSAQPLVN